MLIKTRNPGLNPGFADVLSEIRESNPPHRLGKTLLYVDKTLTL